MEQISTATQVQEDATDVAELRVGIVGCGRMGQRRAQVISDAAHETLSVVADIDAEKASGLAEKMGCDTAADWREVVNNPELDVVVVSVPNKYMQEVVTAALENGKHVLCEKPLGRNSQEAAQMIAVAEASDSIFQVGFNKRFHPAAMKMRELFDTGVLGPVLYTRAIFGHGAQPGLEKTWFASAELAGGGALIDIGVHLVDLIRWFQGDFQEVFAVASTYYWDLDHFDSGLQLDDNAFFIMRTAGGQTAQVHASWTQWKNRFSFEIFGRDGFLRWEGLGGYYGPATLTLAKRRPESGPPLVETLDFDATDNSLRLEWEQFVETVRGNDQPAANGSDALKTMQVIEALYESVQRGEVVSL